MKKLITLTILFFIFFALNAKAEGIKISPSVIDEKVKAKEILKYTVKLKNEKAVRIELYAILFDILPDGSRDILEPSKLDRKTSITKWTSIKRGVIGLNPGEEVEIPLQIDVDLTAIPGVYHSVIAFPEGSNPTIAEGLVNSASQIILNIEVGDQIIEKAQIEKFEASQNIFVKYPASLNLQIKNNGNTALMPIGEILIYNRRDQQVGQLDINSLHEIIEKDTSKKFEIKWTNETSGFGKFKAKLEVEYGEKNKRDLQDTIYFWVFPTKYLIFFGIGLFATTFLLTFLLFKKSRNMRREYQVANMNAEDDDDEEEVINLKE